MLTSVGIFYVRINQNLNDKNIEHILFLAKEKNIPIIEKNNLEDYII